MTPSLTKIVPLAIYLSEFPSHCHEKMKTPKEFRNMFSQTLHEAGIYYHQDLKWEKKIHEIKNTLADTNI